MDEEEAWLLSGLRDTCGWAFSRAPSNTGVGWQVFLQQTMEKQRKNAHHNLLRNVASELLLMDEEERRLFEAEHSGPLIFLQNLKRAGGNLADVSVRGMLRKEFPDLATAHGGHLITVIWSYALAWPKL